MRIDNPDLIIIKIRNSALIENYIKIIRELCGKDLKILIETFHINSHDDINDKNLFYIKSPTSPIILKNKINSLIDENLLIEL